MTNVSPAAPPEPPLTSKPWFRQLTGYHWLVLIVATLAWSFDCFNQQIFNLARVPAMADLLGVSPESKAVADYGSLATSMLLVGWATGGILFGMMGDRVGRAKTLLIMILAYSLSTGLCGLSQSAWHYILFAFITGIGAGGIFPVACTLVAESLPDQARPRALGMLQAFSAVGNVGAGLVWLMLVQAWSRHWIARDWPWLFCVGIMPALLSIIVARRVREPEVWLKAKHDWRPGTQKAGSLIELLSDRRWGPRAAVGLCLAVSGVVGYWGIGVFSNDLTQSFVGRQYDDRMRNERQDEPDLGFVALVLDHSQDLEKAKDKVATKDLLGHNGDDLAAKLMFEQALLLNSYGQPVSRKAVSDALGKDDKNRTLHPHLLIKHARKQFLARLPKDDIQDIDAHIERIFARQRARLVESRTWAAVTLVMFNVGGFFGMYLFARVTQWFGRRLTFALAFIAAGGTTTLAFLFMSRHSDLFWMVPLMGAAQLSVFGGYAIYFPELFPTRLRSTGTSFCYNVGRYIAAAGPLIIAYLRTHVFAGTAEPFRYAGVAMCACYGVGMIALLFAPETKGQPLPE